jgi:bifunctional DNA-binding transcriptional regulator/antitoxin component of YhaV-PrlF toxin-antitoxin module
MYAQLMKTTRISQGGQVQVPAEVRRRWGTRNVVIEDAGAYLVISPLPDDPIGAALGSLPDIGLSTEELIRRAREDEVAADVRKWRELSSTPRP